MKLKSQTLKLFVLWLKSEKERFLYPLRLNKVSKDTIEFNFIGISTAIRGLIQCGRDLDSGIQIWSQWENGSGLFYNQAFEVIKVPQGWSCALCQLQYSSKKEMLINHVFESFLSWCNDSLFQLKLTELPGVEGHWPEAFILKDCSAFHHRAIYKSEECNFQITFR